MITDNYLAPIICCCSLAGTPACMTCRNQYSYKYEIEYKDGIRTEKIKIQNNEGV
jgi:hypothetical protein